MALVPQNPRRGSTDSGSGADGDGEGRQPGYHEAAVYLYTKIAHSCFHQNPPFVDLDDNFPAHVLLEESFEIIRDEYAGVAAHLQDVPRFHEVDPGQTAFSANQGDAINWRTFSFLLFGHWIEENCAACPETTRLLRAIPSITTAFFSILDGGKHIPEHHGVFGGVYRYHLALEVPNDGVCQITIDDEPYRWQEGEGVLFDDVYMHHVDNTSVHRRAVLLIDVKRPSWNFVDEWMFGLAFNSATVLHAVDHAGVALGRPNRGHPRSGRRRRGASPSASASASASDDEDDDDHPDDSRAGLLQLVEVDGAHAPTMDRLSIAADRSTSPLLGEP